jgi:hypothetical protein
MTEQEELKKGVLESKFRQQVEALGEYLDELTDAINLAQNKYRISSVIYLIVAVIWIVSGVVFDDSAHAWFTLAFIAVLIYDNFRFVELMKARSEFRGCIKTLEILGMIPPSKPDGEKKKRKILSEFRDMVKGWAIKKKEAQDKVFAPA